MHKNIPIPSASLVSLALTVCRCRALVETLKPATDAIKKRILEENTFYYTDRFTESCRSGRKSAGAEAAATSNEASRIPQKLEDFELAYYLPATDAAKLYELYDRALSRAGFTTRKPGDCPLLMAQHQLVRAEAELINQSGELHQEFTPAQINSTTLELRRQYIELLLKYIVPFIDQAEIKSSC